MYSASGEWASSHAASDPDEVRSIDTHLLNAVDAISRVCSPGPSHRALDFGCGNGRWLDTLKGRGWRTTGIDPALKSAFLRHEELHTIPAEPQFHFVVLSHVLEHVPAPGVLLARLAKATVIGGWIYVAVPSLDGLPDHQDWPYVLNARAHTSAFSADCLAILLARAGFGDMHVVRVARQSGNSAKRLRVLAQRGAPATALPVHPLEAVLTALRGSSAGGPVGVRALRRQ